MKFSRSYQPSKIDSGEQLRTMIRITEQPNGNLVELLLGDNTFVSAVINTKKWFKFRKIKVVNANGLNYTWVRDAILLEYKSHMES